MSNYKPRGSRDILGVGLLLAAEHLLAGSADALLQKAVVETDYGFEVAVENDVAEIGFAAEVAVGIVVAGIDFGEQVVGFFVDQILVSV